MQVAIDHFRLNIAYVRNLSLIYATALTSSPGLDISDLLRAQVVLAVGALDHYVHTLTRMGVLEVYNGLRPRTAAFSRTKVTLDGVLTALNNPTSDGWLESEIKREHGWQTFQSAEKIAEAVRLFSDVPLWESVADDLKVNAEDLKQQLRLTVDRRNKIAHEADMDPSFPGTKWPIDAALACAAIDFVEQLGEAIQRVMV